MNTKIDKLSVLDVAKLPLLNFNPENGLISIFENEKQLWVNWLYMT
jgi:hypothetical protein